MHVALARKRHAEQNGTFVRPAKILTTTGKLFKDGETLYYRAKTRDCRSCLFKANCFPKAPLRRIQRSIYEEARDVARALATLERCIGPPKNCRRRGRQCSADLTQSWKTQITTSKGSSRVLT